MRVMRYFDWNTIAVLYSDNNEDRECHYVNEGIQMFIHKDSKFFEAIEMKAKGARITEDEIEQFLTVVRNKARSKYYHTHVLPPSYITHSKLRPIFVQPLGIIHESLL